MHIKPDINNPGSNLRIRTHIKLYTTIFYYITNRLLIQYHIINSGFLLSYCLSQPKILKDYVFTPSYMICLKLHSYNVLRDNRRMSNDKKTASQETVFPQILPPAACGELAPRIYYTTAETDNQCSIRT